MEKLDSFFHIQSRHCSAALSERSLCIHFPLLSSRGLLDTELTADTPANTHLLPAALQLLVTLSVTEREDCVNPQPRSIASQAGFFCSRKTLSPWYQTNLLGTS